MKTRSPLQSVSLRLLAMLVTCLAVLALAPAAVLAAPNTSPPSSTVKLVFIHHSTGEAWLRDGYGGLAASLGTNHYFVSDTNYGWGPGGIGSSTDIGDWWTWFRGPSAGTYTSALYANTSINSPYARALANPGGDNTVIMFKSCFPNSAVGGSASDVIPPIGSNPLAGNGMSSLTVGNAKGVYLDLLEYFKTQPDKLFVLVVSPPLKSDATNATQAANARTLANWLVDPNGLLNGYTAGNVFVFDYYTVLTGGHHRIVGGTVEHTAGPSNYSAYPSGDSHPSAAGDQIATSEFVPMLNAAYNAWKDGDTTVTPRPLLPRKAYLSRPTSGKTRVSRKNTYRWHGTLSPKQIGASSVRLEIQQLVRGRWRTYATVNARIGSGASYWSKQLRITRIGTFRIRARHADSDHMPSASAYTKFTVK